MSRAITAVGEDPAAQEKLPQNFQGRAPWAAGSSGVHRAEAVKTTFIAMDF